MGHSLRDLIGDNRVHVIDGAMGTELYNRGFFVNVCYDELNLTEPDLVRTVHAAYVAAGAEIIETNTFGANPVKLSGHGLEDKLFEINETAVTLAREASSSHTIVVGAIGPLGIRIEPWGPTSRDEAVAFFGRQIDGLMAGGVDGFLLETFTDLDEIQAAYAAIRKVSDLPVMAQMTVGEDGNTSYGTPVETIGTTLTQAGVDVIGLNCSVGPAAMLDAVERLAEVTGLPISAQPNAGLPRTVGNRKMYLASPEYMSQYARRLIGAGARFVGGCCGTTPDHVKHIRDYVASLQPRIASTAAIAPVPSAEELPTPELAERSHWGAGLASGRILTSVDIVPPKGWDTTKLLAEATQLKEAGVDAVHVIDFHSHHRMGVLATSVIVAREAGIEPIFHYTCRDRNMIGMVSDLLGSAAVGLRNILITTGDPSAMGPYRDSTAVFDIDSIGLTNVTTRLNRGMDPGGNTIGQPTRFVIGATLDQSAIDLSQELERFAWKIEAGVDFVVTQPVFDGEQLRRVLEQSGASSLPVIVTIWPLTSARNAEFLANEVPGVDVPPDIVDRMRAAQLGGPASARSEGIRIALDAYDAVRDLSRGVRLSSPYGGTATALDFLNALAIPQGPA